VQNYPLSLLRRREWAHDAPAGDPGDWKDLWAAGQGLQTIRSVEPVAAVAGRLAAEYDAAAERFSRRVSAERRPNHVDA